MRTDKIKKRPQDPVNRIEYMEELFDKGLKLIKEAEENPIPFLNFQSEIEKLDEYYSDERWKNDFALDEQGKLPAGLKRGVLSEDGLYNLLGENKEVLETIREKYKDDSEVSAKIRFLNYEAFKKDTFQLLSNMSFLITKLLKKTYYLTTGRFSEWKSTRTENLHIRLAIQTQTFIRFTPLPRAY